MVTKVGTDLSLDFLPYSLRQKCFECFEENGDHAILLSKYALEGNVMKFEQIITKIKNVHSKSMKWKYSIDVKLTMENVEDPFDANDRSNNDEQRGLFPLIRVNSDNRNQNQAEEIDKPSQTFTLTLNFLHFVILCRRSKILKCLMNNVDIPDDDWKLPIVIDKEEMKKNIAEEDDWIFEANCLHLAARYHPKALNVLLSQLKEKDKMIKESHQKRKTSPLHVATFRTDSLSSR